MVEEPVIEIGLREIYDTVVKTHDVVKDMSPRLVSVEKTADKALEIATAADARSKNNERQLKLLRNAVGTILGGTILALITDWITKHMH